MTIKTAKHD